MLHLMFQKYIKYMYSYIEIHVHTYEEAKKKNINSESLNKFINGKQITLISPFKTEMYAANKKKIELINLVLHV